MQVLRRDLDLVDIEDVGGGTHTRHGSIFCTRRGSMATSARAKYSEKYHYWLYRLSRQSCQSSCIHWTRTGNGKVLSGQEREIRDERRMDSGTS